MIADQSLKRQEEKLARKQVLAARELEPGRVVDRRVEKLARMIQQGRPGPAEGPDDERLVRGIPPDRRRGVRDGQPAPRQYNKYNQGAETGSRPARKPGWRNPRRLRLRRRPIRAAAAPAGGSTVALMAISFAQASAGSRRSGGPRSRATSWHADSPGGRQNATSAPHHRRARAKFPGTRRPPGAATGDRLPAAGAFG